MSPASHPQAFSTPAIQPHTTPASQPLLWLRRAWDDLLHHRGASLTYGAVVAAVGLLILSMARHPYVLAAALSGFLLVGPVLATGLCEISRRRESGQSVDLEASLGALSRNRTALLQFSGILFAISLAWFVLSSLMLHLALGNAAPGLGETMWLGLPDVILDVLTTSQLVAYLVVGGLLAAAVFALSAVSIPMIIERDVAARDAMRTSLQVTIANLPTMAVWAAMIVVLVGIGFATFLVGMVLIFPLLGHATWHAYRDLVK